MIPGCPITANGRVRLSAYAKVDCLIIGGGPAGLTAAIYLARFRRKVLVVDGGASRAALIPTSHNYPGFAAGVSGPDLLKALQSQAEQYDAALRRNEVQALYRLDGGAFRATVGAHSIVADKVVLATGLVDHTPDLPSMRAFIYRGAIRFCPICDAHEAIDKRIGVIGPIKQASKKALFLRTYSKQVSVLPLGDPSPDDDDRRQLRDAGLAVPVESVADLVAAGDTIAVVMRSGARCELDVLYPAMGADIRSELATRLGARSNDNGCLFVDDRQRTSVPGLYAIGTSRSNCTRSAWRPGRPRSPRPISTAACRPIRASHARDAALFH
jgi:thioredoxin reductase (NADPH)